MNRIEKEKLYFESIRKIGPYLGLGSQLAATVVIMFFIGKWLDEYLNTMPVFILIFTFLGGFAGLYNFIQVVLKLNKRK